MKNFLHNTWKHRAHIVMALPAFLVLLFFAYIPMGGLVMAFKSYDYTKGIWGIPRTAPDSLRPRQLQVPDCIKVNIPVDDEEYIILLCDLHRTWNSTKCSACNCD